MKRSEFLKDRSAVWSSFDLAYRDARAAELAGIKWDPEEPELPRKLVLCDRTNVVTVHAETAQSETLFGVTVGDPPRSTAIKSVIRSALDAYNKLQSGELVETSVSAEEILKLLHERDNLRQSLDVAIRERGHLNRLLKCERDLVARLEERLKGVDALQERDVALAELRETRLLLRDIAAAVGLSWRPHETWAECSQLALDIRTAIVAHQRPADVISKTRGGRTVHYAVGPTRETQEEAERDLREWFDKEAS